MKHLLLSVLLLPAMLAAQTPVPADVPAGSIPVRRRLLSPPAMPGMIQTNPEALPDNYQLTLTITDKDGQPVEVSVVVASSQFNASYGELNLTFNGSLTMEESGNVVVLYSLGWQTPMTANGSTSYSGTSLSGSVRLKLGEEVQIIRAGPRVARLSIQKLGAAKAK